MLASLKFICSLLFLLCGSEIIAQLSSPGCSGLTNYTNGQPNDPIYYFQPGQLGELTVVPEVAGASFNFVWYRFTTGSFNWTAYQTQNNHDYSEFDMLSN